jgi:hypothetical protein
VQQDAEVQYYEAAKLAQGVKECGEGIKDTKQGMMAKWQHGSRYQRDWRKDWIGK